MLSLVFVLYALLASTFSVTKAALDYLGPNLLVAIRMLVAGVLLLSYWRLFGRDKKFPSLSHLSLFLGVAFFHIFLSYVPEHWALQYMVSAKACLFFNLSPFVTAVFEWYMFGRCITRRQFGALLLGFVSLLPLILPYVPAEHVGTFFGRVSLPEIVLFIAVLSASYGWILVKRLVTTHSYSPIIVNGIAMIGGGAMALVASCITEGVPHIYGCMGQAVCWPDRPVLALFGPEWGAVAMTVLYVAFLIIVTNFLFYNLYAYLMRCYSATFLSLCGLMTPLFAALFGFVLRGEQVAYSFFVALAGMSLALFLFYRQELCHI